MVSSRDVLLPLFTTAMTRFLEMKLGKVRVLCHHAKLHCKIDGNNEY